MSSSKAARVASAPLVDVEGTWQRHVSAPYSDRALDGRRGYGRWGTGDGFPVLYLGRPTDSVVVEAYRHLIDPVLDDAPPLQPRVLVTASVAVTEIVDLRSAAGRLLVGLVPADLTSGTDDREAYARCQEVAQVAHQLGRRGLITPAATEVGETLVLFTDLLPQQQRPMRSADDVLWTALPPDPRNRTTPRLRVVPDVGS